MDRAKEDQPESSSLEGCCCGPLFHKELKGISQVSQDHGRRVLFHIVKVCPTVKASSEILNTVSILKNNFRTEWRHALTLGQNRTAQLKSQSLD